MGQELQKVGYTHDAMIDMIIAEPTITQGQLAARFGYTQGWVSQVMSSDAFKARLEARRGEIIDPVLLMSVDEKLKAVCEKSIAVVAEKLNASQVSDGFATKTLEVTTRALGYGAGTGTPPQAPTPLEKLADNIMFVFDEGKRRLQNGNTYEAEPANAGKADSST